MPEVSEPHSAHIQEAQAPRSFWRQLLHVVGPGLVVMLADTDAGSIITIAQSGAQWGYRLILANLLFIPFMFIAQELAARLGLGTKQGCTELVLRRIGRMPAMLLFGALAVSCFGALLSEMSALAGAGAVFGLPIWVTVFGTVAGLMLIVTTGSYRVVERVALFIGLFELAFLVMAWRARPDVAQIVREIAQQPLSDRNYLYLLAANLGSSVIPWALIYQQAASVDKGLGVTQIRAARLETLAGVILCQLTAVAFLIAAAATLNKGVPLQTVTQIGTAFTATLGASAGQIVFVVGLSASALVATIVVCLTLAWSFGEIFAVRHSLEHKPSDAPWFYGSLAVVLIAAGTLVSSGVNLVNLSIAAGVVNALLLPVILGFLYYLSRTAVPPQIRLSGVYGVIVAVAFVFLGGVSLVASLAGVLGH